MPSWYYLCLQQHKGCYYSRYKEPGSCYYALQEVEIMLKVIDLHYVDMYHDHLMDIFSLS